MKKIFALLLILTSPSFGQPVQQSGNVTPGHVTSWITDGVIGDGGPLGGGATLNGMFNAFDFLCANSMSNTPLVIDCGFSATGTNTWNGLQNFSGGATAPTRTLGDSTTNAATTAFVQNALSTPPVVVAGAWTLTATDLFGAGNILATGTIQSNAGFNINGAAGLTQTCTVNTASALTLIFTLGILTGGTCNS